MTNIKDYENTVTERIYDLVKNINPCESCKYRGGTTDKCENCCWWYASEFVMGDESEAEKPTSDKNLTNALEIIKVLSNELNKAEKKQEEITRKIMAYAIADIKDVRKEAAEIIKEILSRPDGQISYETRAKAEQFLSEADK